MSESRTTWDLFDLAISIEKKAESFYRELSEKFSGLPEVSDFWKSMMRDEIRHADELHAIRYALSDDQLREPADVSTIRAVEDEAIKFAAEYDPAKVETLDDSYELAHKLESSEINLKIEYLIKEFVPLGERVRFLMEVLENHVKKLDEFSKVFGDVKWRRGVKAS